jgi:hypothetical protein
MMAMLGGQGREEEAVDIVVGVNGAVGCCSRGQGH